MSDSRIAGVEDQVDKQRRQIVRLEAEKSVLVEAEMSQKQRVNELMAVNAGLKSELDQWNVGLDQLEASATAGINMTGGASPNDIRYDTTPGSKPSQSELVVCFGDSQLAYLMNSSMPLGVMGTPILLGSSNRPLLAPARKYGLVEPQSLSYISPK